MPVYDYRCLTCDEVFEQRSAIAEADDVRCAAGHEDVKRLLSVFAVARGANPPVSAGGGCCGGACGCG